MRFRLVIGLWATAAVTVAGFGWDMPRATAGPVRLLVAIPEGAEAAGLLEQRLAEGFTAGLRAAGEAGAEVVAMAATVHEAARRLRARDCDAVVVLGADRPTVLRKVACRTFAGTLGRRFAYRPAYLLMPGGDAAREDRLAEIFPRALRALDGVATRDATAEQ